MTKQQLLEGFEEAGFNLNAIKNATKATNVTGKLLNELHVAWSRIPKHPVTSDFQRGEWSAICKEFKDRFSHILPNTEPESRIHLQQLWLECVWKDRENVSLDKEALADQEGGEEDLDVSLGDKGQSISKEQHPTEARFTDDEVDRAQLEELEHLARMLTDEAMKAKDAQAERAKKIRFLPPTEKDYLERLLVKKNQYMWRQGAGVISRELTPNEQMAVMKQKILSRG